MKQQLFKSALFRFRNITILLLSLLAACIAMESNIFPLAIAAAVAVYAASVIQSLLSKNFQEKINRKQKIYNIKELNYQCRCLANKVKRDSNVEFYKHGYYKLKKVMDDKNEIYESFFRGEYSYLKEKIVEQALKLVISYIKLLHNFCIRSNDINSTDINEIINRLNMNKCKLSFTKDPDTMEDIKNLIDIDEKTIARFKEEKNDLERIMAKLDYIESTINTFKHRIISNIETEDMLENLETVVNEASALDAALEKRKVSSRLKF